ncbi:MAG: hypothetical protein QOH32_4260 [Bradyrhizobium sp.]|jgi:hypothetical protein|nr:hypothetical protein [Bradyrhizobium sp.]
MTGVPDAVQREAMHREKPGSHKGAEFVTIPVLQRNASRCIAPGKQERQGTPDMVGMTTSI